MALDGQEIMNQAKAGTLSLADLQTAFANASSNDVTIQDWGVCYSSATGQLSEFCTVMANNSDNPITGIGMIAYSPNGSQVYAVQYTNAISSPMVATSVGTTLFNPQDSNQVLCVVYGWTAQSSYFFTQTMNIGQCD
jgi:hypothetical protein